MNKLIFHSLIFCFFMLNTKGMAQTSKDVQGTWRIVATTITYPDGNKIKMDSSTHNLTKVITANRIIFTIYDKKTGKFITTGQGLAATKGNQYIETFENAIGQVLLTEPGVFTYKVEGDKLSYEGGTKNMHIVEVLRRIE